MMRSLSPWLAIVAAAAMSAVFTSASAVRSASDECPASGVSWTTQNIQQCIDELTKRIAQAPSNSARKAELLAQRAQLHENLASVQASERLGGVDAALDAALADYSAALAITPQDAQIRSKRTKLLLRMERGEAALKDADALVAQDPTSVTFQSLKGTALALLKRHREAIAVYTGAIALAQSCAEASQLQRRTNEFRHAFDPPLTKEQMLAEVEDKSRPLYDIPEPLVVKLGFPCAPTASNKFEDLVLTKEVLFEQRGDSHRALGDTQAAFADYKYAASISPVRELGSLQLCELEIELRHAYDAVEDCRWVFDFNTYPMLSDPVRAAKVGKFLLEDGDLKGACRIAFPFLRDKAMQTYLDNADIKTLQKRVKAAMQGAGMTVPGAGFCELAFGMR